MIIKPYSPSKYVARMSDLIERLSPQHPQYTRISKEIGAIKAGDYGEEVIYKVLEQMKIPYKCYIFHKVFLFAEFAFELDFLIITPYGVVILEVKNIIGELEFSTNPSQLIQRKEDGRITKYPCPANQLNEYKYQLSQFFLQYNISVPIHGVVIFASRNSFVKHSVSGVKIMYRNEMRSYLRHFPENSSTLSQKEMEKIKEVILRSSYSPPSIPLIEYFSISLKDLKLGVKCENCGFIGMQKIARLGIVLLVKKTIHMHTKKQYPLIFRSVKKLLLIKNVESFSF